MADLNLVEKVIALEGVDLLSNLAPPQLARIASIANDVRLPPGRVVVEGAHPDALYIVVDGAVEVSENGVPLDDAGKNVVLGLWALFDENDASNLSATTIGDTHLLRISRDDFFDLLADNSEMTSAILSTLVRRFRKLAEA